MKSPKLLSMVVLAILMVAGIGCTTLQGTTDGYDDENTSYRRSSLDDPFFYNNYNSRPVLVRDVRTGRTFYIYPNNTNSLYDNRSFDNRYYNDRRYNDNRRRNYGNTNSRPVITDQQRKDQREKADESRKKILGKKN